MLNELIYNTQNLFLNSNTNLISYYDIVMSKRAVIQKTFLKYHLKIKSIVETIFDKL